MIEVSKKVTVVLVLGRDKFWDAHPIKQSAHKNRKLAVLFWFFRNSGFGGVFWFFGFFFAFFGTNFEIDIGSFLFLVFGLTSIGFKC